MMNSALGLKKRTYQQNPGFWAQISLCNTAIKYLQDSVCFNNKGL